MKRKSLIIGLLIAIFSAWFIPEVSAQRRGYYHGRHYYHGHGPRGYYRHRAYAPPPRRVVVVPHYGYRRGYYRPRPHYRSRYYAHPHHYHGRGYGRGRGYGHGRGHGHWR